MIPDVVRAEILRRMQAAEAEHGVRIVLAIESGSRAWGFASPDSDYDARFIYAHRPEWYLSIGLEEKRDVIEYPIVDDIDLNGWDVRKALRLYWKSNPAFVEWIQSPIVYREQGTFAARVRALLARVYSCESGAYHYRSMAKTNFRTYLQGDAVRLKKYFYVLRPLLAVRWLARYAAPAPIEFDKLLHLIGDEPALVAEIEALLARKRDTPELGVEAPVPRIHAFIESELARLESYVPPRAPQQGDALTELDAVFRAVLDEADA